MRTRRAVEFLNFIDSISVLSIVAFEADAIASAATIVRKYADQNLTLADAHGLAVMKSRKISTCWSSDRHLTLGGATLAI